MTTPRHISYAFIFALLFLVGWLHLATPLITALFSYFALTKLNHLGCRKPLAAASVVLLMLAGAYGLVHFISQAYVAMPKIISSLLPKLLELAQRFNLELPFRDLDSLKRAVMESMQKNGWTDEIELALHLFRVAIFEAAALIIGLVAAISLFLNARFDPEHHEAHTEHNNLYALSWREIAERFRLFYQSFATVMGAQVLISTINTVLTTVFILWLGLPYPFVLVSLTFLCGMLPIIGNVLSNTLIVGVALTVSPQHALAALGFLVVLHKLEYFLNSKIIGDRIKNPMWLTLLGLILGERLMGIPGMILAPVLLHYIKVEASQNIVTLAEQGAGAKATPAA